MTQGQVQTTVGLLDDGATVPFIDRYRKEAISSLVDSERRLGYITGKVNGLEGGLVVQYPLV